MKTYSILNYYRKLIKYGCMRTYCSSLGGEQNNMERIRNIGILAHIDAGKTTTTERMLFYSGTIRTMGEVHHGNTVTDYMEQERQRGITITSAAVSFPWNGYQLNLIDTPGHIDFTMEVEQSLAVLDGAVVVLDASAGVEAQTLTVWRQANGYQVPRILYLNKMDRADADVAICEQSIRDKLRALPLLLHAPVVHEGRLVGLIDLVTLEEVVWSSGRGQNLNRRKLSEATDTKQWERAMTDRRQIIDTLSSIDDELADTIIQQESLDNIDTQDIVNAIRRCTLNMSAFPVLCGSSYKNIGVQTLMDAVISYLPNPIEGSRLQKYFGADLCARAFKVQHDDQRGVLTFLRLYGGEFTKAQKIYNIARDSREQAGALYVALADEYRPVERVTAGNIAVVSGLKATMTGDLVTSSNAAASRAKSRLREVLNDPKQAEQLLVPSARQRLQAIEHPSTDDMADVLLGIGTTIPEPVFLRSIEPPSAAYQNSLETALEELQREDPSLRISSDEETGQMVLAGMGELHLEIIKERIIREYKIDVELGPPQIAYKEALLGSSKFTVNVDRKIGSARQQVKITLSAKTVKGVSQENMLRFDKSAESAANLSHIHPRYEQAILRGVHSAVLHGPKLGCPVVDVQVTLHWLEVGRGTADTAVSAAAVQCLRKIFELSGSMLLEPIMSLQIVVPESHSARVMADLTRRRADINHIHIRHGNKVIDCLAPLSELVGYSSTLRSLSSGLATFTMEFHSNRQMSQYDEEKAITAITGF